MKRGWVVAAVALQVLVLAVMAGEREWIAATGQVVYLRTAPLDPRDLFRGDYVHLDYEINTLPPHRVGDALKVADPVRHQVVYTALGAMGEGLFEATDVGLEPPAEGPYIRGRLRNRWRNGNGLLYVDYGIEQYFVEQGAGLAIEKRRGDREGLQVPMEMEVALSGSGKAVLLGYRWSPLGMKLEVTRRPARRVRNQPPPEGPLSPEVAITLTNVSDAPLTIVDPGESCGFHLVDASWGSVSFTRDYLPCQEQPIDAEAVRRLQPGEEYRVVIDLSQPRWWVEREGEAVEMGALDQFARFRIEYRSPDPGRLADRTDPQSVWQGRLPSRAFNAGGFID